jgi:hypothetical protein
MCRLLREFCRYMIIERLTMRYYHLNHCNMTEQESEDFIQKHFNEWEWYILN